MNRELTGFLSSIPVLIRNTHLDISLQGWSAAASVAAICLSALAACYLKLEYASARAVSSTADYPEAF